MLLPTFLYPESPNAALWHPTFDLTSDSILFPACLWFTIKSLFLTFVFFCCFFFNLWNLNPFNPHSATKLFTVSHHFRNIIWLVNTKPTTTNTYTVTLPLLCCFLPQLPSLGIFQPFFCKLLIFLFVKHYLLFCAEFAQLGYLLKQLIVLSKHVKKWVAVESGSSWPSEAGAVHTGTSIIVELMSLLQENRMSRLQWWGIK